MDTSFDQFDLDLLVADAAAAVEGEAPAAAASAAQGAGATEATALERIAKGDNPAASPFLVTLARLQIDLGRAPKHPDVIKRLGPILDTGNLDFVHRFTELAGPAKLPAHFAPKPEVKASMEARIAAWITADTPKPEARNLLIVTHCIYAMDKASSNCVMGISCAPTQDLVSDMRYFVPFHRKNLAAFGRLDVKPAPADAITSLSASKLIPAKLPASCPYHTREFLLPAEDGRCALNKLLSAKKGKTAAAGAAPTTVAAALPPAAPAVVPTTSTELRAWQEANKAPVPAHAVYTGHKHDRVLDALNLGLMQGADLSSIGPLPHKLALDPADVASLETLLTANAVLDVKTLVFVIMATVRPEWISAHVVAQIAHERGMSLSAESLEQLFLESNVAGAMARRLAEARTFAELSGGVIAKGLVDAGDASPYGRLVRSPLTLALPAMERIGSMKCVVVTPQAAELDFLVCALSDRRLRAGEEAYILQGKLLLEDGAKQDFVAAIARVFDPAPAAGAPADDAMDIDAPPPPTETGDAMDIDAPPRVETPKKKKKPKKPAAAPAPAPVVAPVVDVPIVKTAVPAPAPAPVAKTTVATLPAAVPVTKVDVAAAAVSAIQGVDALGLATDPGSLWARFAASAAPKKETVELARQLLLGPGTFAERVKALLPKSAALAATVARLAGHVFAELPPRAPPAPALSDEEREALVAMGIDVPEPEPEPPVLTLNRAAVDVLMQQMAAGKKLTKNPLVDRDAVVTDDERDRVAAIFCVLQK